MSGLRPARLAILRTLRGRLIAAMLAIMTAAMLASVALDDAANRMPPWARALGEPYQDGLVLVLFSLPALVLIWWVSVWSLRPLERASRQARAIGPGQPTVRIAADGLPAEVVPLVEAVNAALDRMTDAFAAERRFTEDAAHELRTPLAVLSLRLQRARAGAADGGAAIDWPAIEDDLAQLNRLVAGLLTLARAEHAGRTEARAGLPEVNLCRLAREAAAGILPLAEARGRTLSVDLPDVMLVRGEAPALRDAIANLLENAVLHGAGGIGLSAAGRALIVSDEGPGLPKGQEAAMFDRFQKGAGSEGSGLGLAIARGVLRAHGGEVNVLPGPNCRIELRLPEQSCAGEPRD